MSFLFLFFRAFFCCVCSTTTAAIFIAGHFFFTPLLLLKKEVFFYLSIRLWFAIIQNMKKYAYFVLLLLGGCAYHNPLDKADFHFQTLSVPPYVLSSWYRIDTRGEPLTVYVEKEQMDTETRDLVVLDKSQNVAYVARPCQYFQTSVCETKILKKQSDDIVQKGIRQLQKKAATQEVVVKGL